MELSFEMRCLCNNTVVFGDVSLEIVSDDERRISEIAFIST